MSIDRIIIVTNYLPPRNSGAGQRAYNHAKYFKTLGYNVSLVCEYPFGTSLLEFQKRNNITDGLEKQELIEINYAFDLENAGGIKKILLTIILIPKLFFQVLRKIKSDKSKNVIVHGFSTSLLAYLTIFASKLSFKKVATLLEITSLYPPGFRFYGKPGWQNKVVRYLFRKQLRIPSKIITLSPANNDNYSAFMGKYANSELITNGIDPEKFFRENATHRDELRKTHNLPIDIPIIVYVGAIHPHKKRVDIFLELMASISKSEPNLAVKFLFIGNNDRTEIHRKLTSQLIEVGNKSLNVSVQFTGHVENVSVYLKCADIYILPSEAEGLPNSVIEAMACGLPVVMNRIEGISDFILTHNETGFIINNNSISEYLRIITMLLTNPEAYSKISQNAQNCISERFTDEIVNQKYLSLYLKLLN